MRGIEVQLNTPARTIPGTVELFESTSRAESATPKIGSLSFLVLTAAGLGPVAALQAADRDWPVYLGDKASTHFSTLEQINRNNVKRLQVAWTYHCGDGRQDDRSQIQCNPLVIDGVLFGTSPQLKLLALDAATGHELWRFDPFADRPGSSSAGVNRGVVYWTRGRQFLVIACGGGKMGTRSGDAYVAFALPERGGTK